MGALFVVAIVVIPTALFAVAGILYQKFGSRVAERKPWSGAVKMIVGGSLAVLAGTVSTIYGSYANSNLDEQRIKDLWYNDSVNFRPGDPFFIAGLVVLGVGAVLLIGGVAWLIVAKNRRDN